jgi:hypothetical protein
VDPVDAEAMLKFITDRQIYEQVICTAVIGARRQLWLATADLKDLYVEKNGRMAPFLEVLSDLIARNVEIRLLHAKELHGSGIIINDAFDAMNYPYPNPPTVHKMEPRRMSDMELTMAFCTMGPGFKK